MDRSRHNSFDRTKDRKKQDSSARSKHVGTWGQRSESEAAETEKKQGSNLVEQQKREPLSSNKPRADSAGIVGSEGLRKEPKTIEEINNVIQNEIDKILKTDSGQDQKINKIMAEKMIKSAIRASKKYRNIPAHKVFEEFLDVIDDKVHKNLIKEEVYLKVAKDLQKIINSENSSRNRDIRSQRENTANHESFMRPMRYDAIQENYDQHKQEIHEKLNDLEKNYNELKKKDQRLEKRFKNLSWFKGILGIDSKKKIDKCEYKLKRSRKELKDAIGRLENTIQGNPAGYAVASVRDFIRLRSQDENQLQQRIDRIKPGEPQPGDKQTPRQKRFEEQEAIRNQQLEDSRVNDVRKYKETQNAKIDAIKEDTDKMVKEHKKQISEIRNPSEIFQKSKDLSSEISLWKFKIESMQRNEVSHRPDLMMKCNNLKEEFNKYQRELDNDMTKTFGARWTSRYIPRR